MGVCRKAIEEQGGQMIDIIHTGAATCTNASSRGFGQEVGGQLGLRLDLNKILLHGVGCAGGLAALSATAQMAPASGNKPVKILIFACEIPSSLAVVQRSRY